MKLIFSLIIFISIFTNIKSVKDQYDFFSSKTNIKNINCTLYDTESETKYELCELELNKKLFLKNYIFYYIVSFFETHEVIKGTDNFYEVEHTTEKVFIGDQFKNVNRINKKNFVSEISNQNFNIIFEKENVKYNLLITILVKKNDRYVYFIKPVEAHFNGVLFPFYKDL